MKSQKGITMVSLIIYVVSFLLVAVTIAGITTFFYNNIEVLDDSIGSNSQYNKFNLYLLNECKKEGNELLAWRESDESKNVFQLVDNELIEKKFITFEEAIGKKNSFIYDDENSKLYYNSIKLCDNVEDFQIKVEEVTGKTVLKIFIKIEGTSFSTEYVLKS